MFYKLSGNLVVMKDKKQYTADLTSYAALLGDSFSSKINLLTQIVQGAHYPSIGRYKERLLSKAIAEYIPRGFEVGTGFVLFPTEQSFEGEIPKGFDPLNMSAHVLSRQCDIIIYDANSFPIIFRDDDFVVVRPESVKSIIEVKGSLSPQEITSCLEGIIDFSKKWRECQVFYKEHGQECVARPSMYVMAWDFARRENGSPKTNGTKIRRQIVEFYRKNVDPLKCAGFPMLDKLFVYKECEISHCGWIGEHEGELIAKDGWHTASGQFIGLNDDGDFYRSSDRTIASLLAGIHYSLGGNFNRFFSYAKEMHREEVIPYEHEGFDFWTDEDKVMSIITKDTP